MHPVPTQTTTTHRSRILFTSRRCLAIIAAFGLSWVSGTLADPPEGEAARIKLAEAFVRDLAEGRFDKATAHYDATMRTALPAAKLEAIWSQLVATNGALASFDEPRTGQIGPYEVVFVPAVFERARLDVKVVFDQKNHIAGLFFVPAGIEEPTYEPPAYDHADRYSESEVEFGEAPWRVKGKLTRPKTRALAPVVVLVHGSGPHDEDESIGPNKPFRDLAAGLSSNGIAVLRYQKRTFAHRDQLIARGTITLHEEAIDDALAALAFVRTQTTLDRSKVHLLGHSLGGTMAPQIAKEDGKLLGVILLAGTPRDPFEVVLEQLAYIASIPGPGKAQALQTFKEAKKLIAQAKVGTAPKEENLLGAPVSYWQELQSLSAASPPIIAKLPCRVLVIGGGRDYQVTRTDFDLYRDALKKNKRATLKWFPDMNHLFIKGKGKATPAEYSQTGHVDEAVIRSLVRWISGE